MKAVTMIALAILFAGCSFTPYVSYQHLSQPDVKGDGYDLGCVGAERSEGRYRIDGGVCQNIRGGTFARVDARVLFGEGG